MPTTSGRQASTCATRASVGVLAPRYCTDQPDEFERVADHARAQRVLVFGNGGEQRLLVQRRSTIRRRVQLRHDVLGNGRRQVLLRHRDFVPLPHETDGVESGLEQAGGHLDVTMGGGRPSDIAGGSPCRRAAWRGSTPQPPEVPPEGARDRAGPDPRPAPVGRPIPRPASPARAAEWPDRGDPRRTPATGGAVRPGSGSGRPRLSSTAPNQRS